MSKVVENTFRDINIAFANELAKICRSDNMDVYEIIRIANKHPRVNILNPGPGVGGHCISVDPWFLVGDYPGLANIILAARKINDSMPEFVLNRIYEIMQEKGMKDIARVGLYGLTYKENVDDVRESPTIQLLNCMKKHLAEPLLCYDPFIKTKIVDNQVFSLEEFLDSVDMVVIMVGHSEIVENSSLLAGKIILDTRRFLSGSGEDSDVQYHKDCGQVSGEPNLFVGSIHTGCQ
jgi:UDP-N-acetyl-D-mannosaminuronic acid dehydrogenase